MRRVRSGNTGGFTSFLKEGGPTFEKALPVLKVNGKISFSPLV